MFKSRSIESHKDWIDETDIKTYSISATNALVDQTKYLPRLKAIKLTRQID